MQNTLIKKGVEWFFLVLRTKRQVKTGFLPIIIYLVFHISAGIAQADTCFTPNPAPPELVITSLPSSVIGSKVKYDGSYYELIGVDVNQGGCRLCDCCGLVRIWPVDSVPQYFGHNLVYAVYGFDYRRTDYWYHPITTCAPSCNDGIQNQGEAGVDCGGPCSSQCPEIADGKDNNGDGKVDEGLWGDCCGLNVNN